MTNFDKDAENILETKPYSTKADHQKVEIYHNSKIVLPIDFNSVNGA